MNKYYVSALMLLSVSTSAYAMDRARRALDEQNYSAKRLCLEQAGLGFLTAAAGVFGIEKARVRPVAEDPSWAECVGMYTAVGSCVSTIPLALHRVKAGDFQASEKVLVSCCCYIGGLVVGTAVAFACTNWGQAINNEFENGDL